MHALLRRARIAADAFVSANFRALLMAFVAFMSAVTAKAFSLRADHAMVDAALFAGAAFEVIIVRCATNLPTRDQHARFIATYLSGPFSERVRCPKVKAASRIVQMSAVMEQLPELEKRLIASGASKEAVRLWSDKLTALVKGLYGWC